MISAICNIITILVTVLAIIGVSLFIVCPIFKIRPYIVLSSSMEPTIKTGSIVWINEKNIENIEKGEIITYKLDDSNIVTHRVDSFTSENSIITKGDNNKEVDFSPIVREQVIGKYLFHIEYLGYIVNGLKSRPIIIVPIVSIIVFLFVLESYYKGE